MKTYSVFLMMVLSCVFECYADTFVNKRTGESFNGYATEKMSGAATLVRKESGGTEYINLRDFEIQRNPSGRRNIVYSFSISSPVDINAEVEAFEKSLLVAANQGPVFILMEIDSPGGRKDLVKRICESISSMANTDVIAFIKRGLHGGAISEAVTIAMACDKIYMQEGSNIGTREFSKNEVDLEKVAKGYAKKENITDLQWRNYVMTLAGVHKRPKNLVRAMFDDNIELVEVKDSNGNRSLMEASEKREESLKVVRIRCRAGEFLRLTGDEAFRYGLANGVAVSREEFAKEIAGAEVRIIEDRSMLAAKRDFERLQERVDRIVAMIRQGEMQAATLTGQINQIDRDFYRRGPGYYYERGGYMNDFNESFFLGRETYTNAETMVLREALMRNLLVTLQDLTRQYNQLIPLVQRNPDLNEDPNSLLRGLTTVQSRLENIRARIRLGY